MVGVALGEGARQKTPAPHSGWANGPCDLQRWKFVVLNIIIRIRQCNLVKHLYG